MINIINKNFRINNIEGIIFDKDGTLTDSSYYWAEIIKRRSGYRYTKGEWDSIRYIYGIGYFNFFNYLFHIISRTLIRVLPFRLISITYSKFLRK